jgi:integrase
MQIEISAEAAPGRRADLTKGVWTKPGSTTKQKTDHVVPLSAAALQILKEIRAGALGGEFVFPGRDGTGHVVDIKGFWAKICRAAGVARRVPVVDWRAARAQRSGLDETIRALIRRRATCRRREGCRCHYRRRLGCCGRKAR